MSQNTLKIENNPAVWYKHRWAWFLFALPAIVVFACFITMYFAFTHDDGVVDDDYYKSGLVVNRSLARDDKARSLGLKAGVSITNTAVEVKLSGNKAAVLTGQPIQMKFQNMVSKNADQELTVVPTEAGVWRGQLAKPLESSTWQVSLETEEWRLMNKLKSDFSASFSMQPK